MTQGKWLRRTSLEYLRVELKSRGYPVSRPTISRLLKKYDYSLKSNRKEHESSALHPERDAQFKYIASQRKESKTDGIPTISIDGKKKEPIGNFKNAGKSWCLEAEKVNVHDFLPKGETKAVPHGIYDIQENRGYVSVGKSSDTAEFAVDNIREWWVTEAQFRYPGAKKLKVLSDGGGSNSSVARLWKQQIQEKLCDELGLEVTIHHYPPGCSKWNPIEHRLFSQVSSNWAGQPLRSIETMLGYINGTTTSTGLTVTGRLNEKKYVKGIKISDQEMKSINIEWHKTCPKWNYTIRPRGEFVKSISEER